MRSIVPHPVPRLTAARPGIDCSSRPILPVNAARALNTRGSGSRDHSRSHPDLTSMKRGDMMLILSMKEGHDGGIAAIEDGRLLFALEAEKDNYPRYERVTGELMAR